MGFVIITGGQYTRGVNRTEAGVVGDGVIASAIVGHDDISIDILIKPADSDETYTPLTGDSVVSGVMEVAVKLPHNSQACTYVEYKLNGFNYTLGSAPSYDVKIDTTDLPDGWNQLLVISYKENSEIKGVKQVIFKVNNNKILGAKAPRRGNSYAVGQVPLYKRNYIPVLMYHDFQEKITKEQESAVVHPNLFENQLKMLIQHGYTPIHFNHLNLYLKGEGGLPLKPVIITADDGYLSNYEVAFPILKKHHIPATFFVTTRYIGVKTSMPHFTWEQAKEMEESGLIDIQSHTHSHQLLNRIPDHEMRHQVGVSFGLIEQHLGQRDVKVLAYPQFYNNAHTRNILKEEGVDLQITALGKAHNPTTAATNIQRIHVTNSTGPEDLIRAIRKLTH